MHSTQTRAHRHDKHDNIACSMSVQRMLLVLVLLLPRHAVAGTRVCLLAKSNGRSCHTRIFIHMQQAANFSFNRSTLAIVCVLLMCFGCCCFYILSVAWYSLSTYINAYEFYSVQHILSICLAIESLLFHTGICFCCFEQTK